MPRLGSFPDDSQNYIICRISQMCDHWYSGVMERLVGHQLDIISLSVTLIEARFPSDANDMIAHFGRPRLRFRPCASLPDSLGCRTSTAHETVPASLISLRRLTTCASRHEADSPAVENLGAVVVADAPAPNPAESTL